MQLYRHSWHMARSRARLFASALASQQGRNPTRPGPSFLQCASASAAARAKRFLCEAHPGGVLRVAASGPYDTPASLCARRPWSNNDPTPLPTPLGAAKGGFAPFFASISSPPSMHLFNGWTVRRSLGYSHRGQEMIALQLADIEDLARRALVRAGASDEHADAVADVVMRAEQGECDDTPS